MEIRLVSRQSKKRAMPKEHNDIFVDIEDQNKGHKPNGFFQSLKASSVEFCSSTSLHGLQYVGEKQRHVLER
jgi:hypothetical protein